MSRPVDKRQRLPLPGEVVCTICEGSGREWLMYGGYGMGGFYRCETCNGFGVLATARDTT